MNPKYVPAALVAFAFVTSSCIFVVHDGECDVHTWHESNTTPGSHVEVSETRTISTFQRIEVAGGIDVDVDVGGDAAAAPKVDVRADDNLVKMLRTDVKDGVLVVEWDDTGSRPEPKIPPRVRVQVGALEGVSVTGSGDATVRGLTGPAFQAVVAGSGDVTLKGRVERVSVTVSGSGDVDAYGLEAKEARATCAGSGDVNVSASERVDATVTGSGYVNYRGNPKDVQRTVAGSGRVERDSGGS
jgi:hypothetical protein